MANKDVFNFKGTGVETLNFVRKQSDLMYQDRIPEATKENFREVATAITSDRPLMNAFASTLVNRIGKVIISSKMYSNPLKMFKKGTLELGDTVEEIHVDLIKAKEFNFNEESHPFAKKIPVIKTAFHRVNSSNQYQVTIPYVEFKKAFISESGVESLVDKLTESLYSSFEVDEFLKTKGIIVEGLKQGLIKKVTIPALNKENSSEIVRIIKEYSDNLTFMNDEYNKEGVQTHTKKPDQYLIVHSRFNSFMDVEVLANAFNLSKVEYLGNQVLVDNFLDEKEVNAIIVDENFFIIMDSIFEVGVVPNDAGLYYNTFLTVEQIFSLSPYSNAIAFTTEVAGEVVPEGFGAPSFLTLDQQNPNWNSAMTTSELQALEASSVEYLPLKFNLGSGVGTGSIVDGKVQGFGTEIKISWAGGSQKFTSPITSLENPVIEFIFIDQLLELPKDTELTISVATIYVNNKVEIARETSETSTDLKLTITAE